MSDRNIQIPSLEVLRTHRSEKWRGFADDVIPLPVAEMDFEVAEPIRAILREMVDTSDLGYMGPIPEVGQSFASFAKSRWNWSVDPLQVHLATDVGVGVVEVIRTFMKPGDGLLINSPVYQNFYSWIRETGVAQVDVPFLYRGHDVAPDMPWDVDWDGIEKAYASGIKAHLLCSPHNPLGRIYSKEELNRLVALAKKHDVIIISDEIHAPLTYKEHTFTPLLSLGEDACAQTICVTAASKAWNIAGLKAAIIVTQSQAMDELMKKLPPAVHYRGSILGGFATAAAFSDGTLWLETAIAQLDENRRLLKTLLETHLPQVKYHLPQAGYLAWLDVRDLGLGDEPAATLLREKKVAFNDGFIYGEIGRGYVRLNFATSPEIITAAIKQIVQS